MSSGFWAGAVPPWAYVVGGALGLTLLLIGAWYGYGRGWKHADEAADAADEADEEFVQWAREQAKARRTHPVYRPEVVHEHQSRHDPFVSRTPGCPLCADWRHPTELAHEAWTAHIEQAMDLADPSWSAESARAITTGEIQAITDEMDAWLAVHVYGAPADYGQWLEQQDR